MLRFLLPVCALSVASDDRLSAEIVGISDTDKQVSLGLLIQRFTATLLWGRIETIEQG